MNNSAQTIYGRIKQTPQYTNGKYFSDSVDDKSKFRNHNLKFVSSEKVESDIIQISNEEFFIDDFYCEAVFIHDQLVPIHDISQSHISQFLEDKTEFFSQIKYEMMLTVDNRVAVSTNDLSKKVNQQVSVYPSGTRRKIKEASDGRLYITHFKTDYYLSDFQFNVLHVPEQLLSLYRENSSKIKQYFSDVSKWKNENTDNPKHYIRNISGRSYVNISDLDFSVYKSKWYNHDNPEYSEGAIHCDHLGTVPIEEGQQRIVNYITNKKDFYVRCNGKVVGCLNLDVFQGFILDNLIHNKLKNRVEIVDSSKIKITTSNGLATIVYCPVTDRYSFSHNDFDFSCDYSINGTMSKLSHEKRKSLIDAVHRELFGRKVSIPDQRSIRILSAERNSYNLGQKTVDMAKHYPHIDSLYYTSESDFTTTHSVNELLKTRTITPVDVVNHKTGYSRRESQNDFSSTINPNFTNLGDFEDGDVVVNVTTRSGWKGQYKEATVYHKKAHQHYIDHNKQLNEQYKEVPVCFTVMKIDFMLQPIIEQTINMYNGFSDGHIEVRSLVQKSTDDFRGGESESVRAVNVAMNYHSESMSNNPYYNDDCPLESIKFNFPIIENSGEVNKVIHNEEGIKRLDYSDTNNDMLRDISKKSNNI